MDEVRRRYIPKVKISEQLKSDEPRPVSRLALIRLYVVPFSKKNESLYKGHEYCVSLKRYLMDQLLTHD